MADSSESKKPFVFEVPPIGGRRVFALAFATFLLLFALIVPVKVGFSRFLHGIEVHSALWILVAEFVIGIGIMLRLAYPPRKSWPRLTVQKNHIHYTPGRIERFLGEPVHEMSITPQSSEILLCQKLLKGLNGKYVPNRYRIIASAAGKTEHEIDIGYFKHIDAPQYQEIADGITSTTGLPVRLIQRMQSTEGVKEIPWVPSSRKANLKLSATMMLGFLPFIGGGVVGYFVTRPALIVFLGLALWLCELLVISALGKHQWTRRTALRGLTTIFTFGAVYAAAATFALTVLRHR